MECRTLIILSYVNVWLYFMCLLFSDPLHIDLLILLSFVVLCFLLCCLGMYALLHHKLLLWDNINKVELKCSGV